MALVNGEQDEAVLDLPVNLHRICEACVLQHSDDRFWKCPHDFNTALCAELGPGEEVIT